MTRLKAKTAKWETQEAVRKVPMEWVEEQDKRNVEDMRQEGNKQLATLQPIGQTGTTEEDSARKALMECQPMMPLGRLLQLVPRFTENLKTSLTPPEPTAKDEQLEDKELRKLMR